MRRRIKVLAPMLMAMLAMLAVTAGAAKAAEVGSVIVNGKVLTAEESIEAVGKGEALKLLVPSLKLTIECESTEVNASGGNYIVNKLGKKESILHLHALYLALWRGCHISGSTACTIYPTEAALETGKESGLVHFHALLLWLTYHIITVEPLLHMDYVSLTPIAGSTGFATLYFGGPKCTLPEEAILGGTTALRVPDFTDEAVEHSFEDLTLEEEKVLAEEKMQLGLKFGNEAAEIDGGNAKLHLAGTLLGKTYSVE